ncbi:flagellar protein FlaG [Sulfurivirga sp.]|uniref:flagellar protein FlaG n=1 Tax=Sulfurivirga sp. TaxID=2614236 RepID=UPI0025F8C827|nr:flagellar protein FlaG [Sulfurivirga sp.]
MNIQAERQFSSLELARSRFADRLPRQNDHALSADAPLSSGFASKDAAGRRVSHVASIEVDSVQASLQPVSGQSLERVRNYLEQRNIQLRFEVDRETGALVMALRDALTGELVRQIPPEERLRFMQRIDQYLDQLRQKAEGALITTRA